MLRFSACIKSFLLLLIATISVPAIANHAPSKTSEGQVSPMRSWFDTWHRNRLEYNAYNDSIFIRCERQEWIELCIRRAAAYRRMFKENQACIDSLHAYFRQPASQITRADYDTLFSLCETNGKGIDVFMANDLIGILEKHFADHHETPEDLLNYLTSLYYRASFNYQFNYFGGDDFLQKSYDCVSRQLAYNDHPIVVSTKDLQERMLMTWGVFTLLSDSYVRQGIISQQKADSIINDVRERLETPAWSWIGDFVNGNLEKVYVPIAGCEITDDERRLLKRYYDFIQSYKGASKVPANYESLYKNDIFRLTRARWRQNRITADEAMHVLDSLKETQGDTIPNLNELINGGLTDATAQTQFLSEIIDSTSLSIEERRKRAKGAYHHFYLLMQACQGRNDIRNSSALELSVNDKALLAYLNRDEHLHLLNKVMLTLQVNSYAHSTHLRILAIKLLRGIIKNQPDLLLGMPGCETVDQIRTQEDSLVSFIGQAALFHDLGKNVMGAIVTNDFRKLYDEEFNILRSHPEQGLKYLETDSTFHIYHDITLGHHKWYDGTKGYPMSFDNTKSPIQIMIDIITICDCLEAATDAIGRNYKPDKVFKMLIDEFDSQAGSRYNGDVLKVIHTDDKLWNDLEQEVTPQGCYNNYYEIYQNFFTE